jgi:single-stranded-DNA-specific exonuclease
MKYELIGKNDYLIDPISTILNNRGIEDIERFLNLDESVTYDWRLLNNIGKAVDCLLGHIKEKSEIFIQVDSDCDGLCSSTILINYLQNIFPNINIQWRLHEGKEHGVIVDTVPGDAQLVIIPDAGSNQFDEHRQLKERGIDVIVLDHHECSHESEDAIVVNNQLSPDYPNKNFSGVGIVYRFCKALDDKLKQNHANYYLDLVAVGNIGDMMDLRELETRHYVLQGLKKINNPLLIEIFKKQEYSTKGIVNITNVIFYIVPLINAAVRSANLTEKRDMMKSFLGSQELVYYKRKDVHQPIQVATARQLVNIRSRQNRQRDKGLELIEQRIEERELLKNKILIINVTDTLEKNLTGLVANQISRKYKRPTLLIRQKDDTHIFGGSARGYEKGSIKDLKQFLLDTNKFIMCEGHSNAHGIEIHADNLVEVNDLINETLKDVDIDVELHAVDFSIPARHLNDTFINDIHKLRNIWGSTVEEPLIVIKDVAVNSDSIERGKNNNILKFSYRGIDFIKFKFSEEEYDTQIKQGSLTLDIVGRCSVNEWDGQTKPQIIIEDFEVTKVKKKELVF